MDCRVRVSWRELIIGRTLCKEYIWTVACKLAGINSRAHFILGVYMDCSVRVSWREFRCA